MRSKLLRQRFLSSERPGENHQAARFLIDPVNHSQAYFIASSLWIGRTQLIKSQSVQSLRFIARMVGNGHHPSRLINNHNILVEHYDLFGIESRLRRSFRSAHPQLDTVPRGNDEFASRNARSIEKDLTRINPRSSFYPRQVEVAFHRFIQSSLIKLVRDEPIGLFFVFRLWFIFDQTVNALIRPIVQFSDPPSLTKTEIPS